MRIFRPFMSSSEVIGVRNQPPICTPVLPAEKLLTPNSAASSSQSSWPPPKCSQASISCAVKPSGTAVKKLKPLCLPCQ